MIDMDDKKYDLEGEQINGRGQGPRRRNVAGGLEDRSDTDFNKEGGSKKTLNPSEVQLELDSSGEENQSLLDSKKEPKVKRPRCYAFRRWMGWIISQEQRSISMSGHKTPSTFPTNRQNNQKYNVITLIPVVLFNQFKFFYNFFFLAISLSQFIPPLKVGLTFTYVAPLVFVLAITIMKEAFDDFQRRVKDREINNKKYE